MKQVLLLLPFYLEKLKPREISWLTQAKRGVASSPGPWPAISKPREKSGGRLGTHQAGHEHGITAVPLGGRSAELNEAGHTCVRHTGNLKPWLGTNQARPKPEGLPLSLTQLSSWSPGEAGDAQELCQPANRPGKGLNPAGGVCGENLLLPQV